ncbi:MAG: hypothetical protein LBT84_01790 [Spirochaetia bacterium]|jgi:hypothetical protein|nr:hypothetical protein [Spirochaetia bacterium]
MKKLLFIAVLVPLLQSAAVFASDAGSRASYTRGGWVGARYAAMGQCGAVLADDVYAIYWNPAGLSELKSKKKADADDILDKARTGSVDRITEDDLLNFSEPASEMGVAHLGISAARLDIDRNALFAGGAFGLFSGVLGVGVYSILSLDIPSYDETGAPTGQTAYAGSAGYLSYGWSLGVASVGFSLKGLYERIADYSYAGAAIDAGAQVFVLPFIKLGFAMYDIGTGLMPVNDDNGSLKKEYDLGNPSFRINAAVISDVGFTLVVGFMRKLEQDDYFFNFGVQYNVKQFLSIYAGMNNEDFSAGLTVRIGNLDVSYAFVFDNINGGVNNVVSTSMLF